MSFGQENNYVLRDFVTKNNLMNNYSSIVFLAEVIFDTNHKKKSYPSIEVMITFDSDIYGAVTLIDTENEIDSVLYSIGLKARYQKMRLIGGYLEIKDKHPRAEIGDFTVKIIPIKRLRD